MTTKNPARKLGEHVVGAKADIVKFLKELHGLIYIGPIDIHCQHLVEFETTEAYDHVKDHRHVYVIRPHKVNYYGVAPQNEYPVTLHFADPKVCNSVCEDLKQSGTQASCVNTSLATSWSDDLKERLKTMKRLVAIECKYNLC